MYINLNDNIITIEIIIKSIPLSLLLSVIQYLGLAQMVSYKVLNSFRLRPRILLLWVQGS